MDSAKTEMEKRAKDEFYLAIVMKESGKVIGEVLKNEPYVVEGVWQKVEVETMNVVLVNGEKK